jgi:transcriptional regulator with GAF, ATPase, and Fis domain
LARYFVQKFARQMQKQIETIPAAALKAMTEWDWPGNVRELQNVIERAVILSDGNRLRLDLVSLDRTAPGSDVAPAASGDIVPEREWRQRERANLLAALKRAGGRIHGEGGAAELLGIRPSTLQSRLKAFRISARDSR